MRTRQAVYALLFCIVLPGTSLPALGQDAARGQALYETHCGGCHYERIHQRDRAKSPVRTLDDLRAQVARWATQTQKPALSPQDLRDLVEYLNRSHYRM